jgi:DNA-binding CsgD family transcriptional regulator
MNSDRPIKILFLASDPSDASRLRLGQELREIQQRLQLAKYRDKFLLEQRMSVRPGDISQAILDVEPDIVHFSGHGTNTGELYFENGLGKIQPVAPDALAALFELVNEQVNCVVLNACYSETQAKAISQHIEFVIGMNQAIGDKAASEFAVGFYKALGANHPIEKAYKFGCVEIQLYNIAEHLTPVLYEKTKHVNKNLEPAKYILVLSATIDEVNKPLAEAIIAHLRQISGDASLTLQRIEAGSVKLVLEGSQEGLERILALFREGNLTEVLGISVQNVQVIVSQEQDFERRCLAIALEAEKLRQYWRSRLANECPEQSVENRESIIFWLLGSDLQRFETLNPEELDIAKQAMEYRYRILRQRYLGIGREKAYRNLITRLGSLVTLRNKIQTWIALSRDRQRTVIDVLQEVVQELLQSDTYIQQQMDRISECTNDKRLRNYLLFASVEEYCLRPVRNQPLLVYRFVNYLRRVQHGSLIQLKNPDLIWLTEVMVAEDSENKVNLLDNQSLAEYQQAQKLEQQQVLRQQVTWEFETYLQENLGQDAVEWLRLYLEGNSQDEIARRMNKPVREVYRLREKISYHAVRVFALKEQPEVLDNWLEISFKENNLELIQNQWQQLYEQLTPIQRELLDLRRSGYTIEAIAQQLKLKTHQAIGQWTKVYLVAQASGVQE